MSGLLPTEIAGGGLFAFTDNPYVILAIVIISAITSWVQSRNKKAEQAEPWGGEDDENYKPYQQPAGTAAPNQPLNWEEELKRLLEGKPPLDGTVGAPPVPPPPPIVRRAEPPPLPEPISRESEGVDEESLVSRESSSPWSDTAYDSLPEPTKPLAHFEQSTLAQHRIAQFHETVAAHMHRVDAQVEKHGQPLRAPRPAASRAINADVRAVVGLMRRPATARQVLIASFVLAPPKALEA
jgi:hypothetical protein